MIDHWALGETVTHKIKTAEMNVSPSATAQPVSVSIIMPVFNAAPQLPRAIASVQNQSFPNWELLVIDDGSTDGSAQVAAEKARQDPRITLLSLSANEGAAAARNTGLSAARGRYIAFLDADDEWLPEKLDRQLTFMRETGATLSYTGFWRARGVHRTQVEVPPEVSRDTLLKGNVIGCLTAMYDRHFFGPVTMPALRMRQDFAFWLLLLNKTEIAYGLTQPLAVYHRHPGSLSSSFRRVMTANWILYRRHLGLPAPTALYYLANHLWRRLKRG